MHTAFIDKHSFLELFKWNTFKCACAFLKFLQQQADCGHLVSIKNSTIKMGALKRNTRRNVAIQINDCILVEDILDLDFSSALNLNRICSLYSSKKIKNSMNPDKKTEYTFVTRKEQKSLPVYSYQNSIELCGDNIFVNCAWNNEFASSEQGENKFSRCIFYNKNAQGIVSPIMLGCEGTESLITLDFTKKNPGTKTEIIRDKYFK